MTQKNLNIPVPSFLVPILILGVGPHCRPIFRAAQNRPIRAVLPNGNCPSISLSPCTRRSGQLDSGTRAQRTPTRSYPAYDARSSRSLRGFSFSNGSDSAEWKLDSPLSGTWMLDNFEEWSRVSASWKGAKRMERKAMMGCGWLGRGEVQGRSLSLEYIPTQWMLVTGEGDGEGRNTTYITIGKRTRHGQWLRRTSSLIGLMCGLHVRQAGFTPSWSCNT